MKIYYYLLAMAILGFIIGFIIGFLLLIQSYVEKKNQSSQQKSVSEQNKKKEKDNNAKTKEQKNEKEERFFKERIVDMEQSFTNSMNEEEQKAFIETNRSKQDNAYNYIDSTLNHVTQEESSEEVW